jgi:hypothetical protein
MVRYDYKTEVLVSSNPETWEQVYPLDISIAKSLYWSSPIAVNFTFDNHRGTNRQKLIAGKRLRITRNGVLIYDGTVITPTASIDFSARKLTLETIDYWRDKLKNKQTGPNHMWAYASLRPSDLLRALIGTRHIVQEWYDNQRRIDTDRSSNYVIVGDADAHKKYLQISNSSATQGLVNNSAVVQSTTLKNTDWDSMGDVQGVDVTINGNPRSAMSNVILNPSFDTDVDTNNVPDNWTQQAITTDVTNTKTTDAEFNGTAPTFTNPTFTRTTTAFKKDGSSVSAGNARHERVNMLQNPRFDNGTGTSATGWAFNIYGNSQGTISTSTKYLMTGATRSVHCYCPYQSWQGIYQLWTNMDIKPQLGKVYTATAWVYVVSGRCQIVPERNGSAVISSGTGFQKLSVTFTYTDNTGGSLVVYSYSATELNEFYVLGVQLQEGENSSEFTAAADSCVTSEVGTTNLLTANQAGLTTDLTGFTAYNGATISRVTDAQYRIYGSGAIKIDNSAVDYQGVYTTPVNVSASTAYTYSVYVCGSGQVSIRARDYDAGAAIISTTDSTPFTLTSTPTRITVTKTMASNAVTTRLFVFHTPAGQYGEFYVSGLQIEQRHFATSWHTGAASRNEETITVPIATAFPDPQNWTVEGWYYTNLDATEITSLIYPTIFQIGNYNSNSSVTMMHWGSTTYPSSSHYMQLWVKGQTNAGWSATIGNSGITADCHSLMKRWVHFAATCMNGETFHFYINGTEIGSGQTIADPITSFSGATLYLGWRGGGGLLNGYLYNIRVSNKARSAAEVLDFYQNGMKYDRFVTYMLPCNDLTADVPQALYDSYRKSYATVSGDAITAAASGVQVTRTEDTQTHWNTGISTQLCTNHNFETDTTGWTKYSSPSNNSTFVSSTDWAALDSKSGKFTRGGGETGSVEVQHIFGAVIKNDVVVIDCMVKSVQAGTYDFRIQKSTSPYTLYGSSHQYTFTANEVKHIEFTETMPVTETVRFDVLAPSGVTTFYIDNVRIQKNCHNIEVTAGGLLQTAKAGSDVSETDTTTANFAEGTLSDTQAVVDKLTLAQYGANTSDVDNTTATFGAGSLTNVVAASNKLTLGLSGTPVSDVDNDTATLGAGTLTNVTAASNELKLNLVAGTNYSHTDTASTEFDDGTMSQTTTYQPNGTTALDRVELDLQTYTVTGQGSYRYYKSLNITGGTSALTNYQMRYKIYKGTGTDSTTTEFDISTRVVYLDNKCASWPNDIRFTNNAGTVLNYWIESSDANVAVVWVKVDSIAGSGATTTIKIYYSRPYDSGNSSASNTMIFYEPFTPDSRRTDVWSEEAGHYGGSMAYETHVFENGGYHLAGAGDDETCLLKDTAVAASATVMHVTFQQTDRQNPSYIGIGAYGNWITVGGYWGSDIEGFNPANGTYVAVWHDGSTSNNFRWYNSNGTGYATVKSYNFGSSHRPGFGLRSGNTKTLDMYWKNFFVRQYAASVPTHGSSGAATNIGYFTTGTWTSPADSASVSGIVSASSISWNTGGTGTITVETNWNGAGWVAATNGGAISGALNCTTGNYTIWVRASFSGTTGATPTLLDITKTLTVQKYSATGNRISPDLNINGVGTVGAATVSWTPSSQPPNTTMLVEAAIYNGSWGSYQTCTNGAQIPGLPVGTSATGKQVRIRQTLSTTADAATPSLTNITVSVGSTYAASGNRISPNLDLNGVNKIGSTLISWTNTAPGDSTFTVEAFVTGGSWQACTSGQPIPGLAQDSTVTGKVLQIRQNFTSTTDLSGTPELTNLTVTVNSAYKASGYRTAPALNISPVNVVKASSITWNQTLNGGTLTMETSLDNGATWQAATSGQPISGLALNTVCAGKTLLVRTSLATPTSAASPELLDCAVSVTSAYYSSAYRISPALNLSDVGKVKNSLISWTMGSTPANTSGGAEVSLDGTSWQACSNNGEIPLVYLGFDGEGQNLLVKETFATTDGVSTATMDNITATVNSAYNNSSHIILPAININAAGVIAGSYLVWNNPALPAGTYIGFQSSVDEGATWSDTLTGSGYAIPSLSEDDVVTNKNLLLKAMLFSSGANTATLQDVSAYIYSKYSEYVICGDQNTLHINDGIVTLGIPTHNLSSKGLYIACGNPQHAWYGLTSDRVAVTVGQTYDFSFFTRGTMASMQVTVNAWTAGLAANGTYTVTLTDIDESDWTVHYGSWTIPANTATVSVEFHATGAGYLYVDDAALNLHRNDVELEVSRDNGSTWIDLPLIWSGAYWTANTALPKIFEDDFDMDY